PENARHVTLSATPVGWSATGSTGRRRPGGFALATGGAIFSITPASRSEHLLAAWQDVRD
ncbi:MAG TPA: hypothetical protein PLT86_14995, partial [Candidatus Latescibacteria bacterium]|nr:hypothetical protein [Candidatus Latescibacterota bacterium]